MTLIEEFKIEQEFRHLECLFRWGKVYFVILQVLTILMIICTALRIYLVSQGGLW